MDSHCVFCRVVAGEMAAHMAAETEACLAFLDHRPLFPGHILVIPRVHVQTLPELPAHLIEPLFSLTRRLARLVEVALAAEGSFVAMNNRVSQSVPHLHVHVVPRRRKDGLKGFFWPRHPYASEAEMEAVAATLRAALNGV